METDSISRPVNISRQIEDACSDHGIKDCYRPGTDLSERCTLGIGPVTDLFFVPKRFHQLRILHAIARKNGMDMVPVGGGSNSIFTREATGKMLISMEEFDSYSIEYQPETVVISSEAGVQLPSLVRASMDEGVVCMGVLAGVPGSVGGAIAGNAGTKYGEIGEYVSEVRVLDEGNEQGYRTVRPEFTYRDSSLRGEFILRGRLSIPRAKQDRRRDEFEEIYEKSLNERVQNQPISERSAGCMFKNPDVEPAGKLIDRAGLKGTREGDLEISEKHANYLINHGSATPEQVQSILEYVEETIQDQFDIRLEREIQLI